MNVRYDPEAPKRPVSLTLNEYRVSIGSGGRRIVQWTITRALSGKLLRRASPIDFANPWPLC